MCKLLLLFFSAASSCAYSYRELRMQLRTTEHEPYSWSRLDPHAGEPDRMPDRMSDICHIEIECRKECQNRCQIECLKRCQIDCQLVCHSTRQIECQSVGITPRKHHIISFSIPNCTKTLIHPYPMFHPMFHVMSSGKKMHVDCFSSPSCGNGVQRTTSTVLHAPDDARPPWQR